jgi:hypothetical protein
LRIFDSNFRASEENIVYLKFERIRDLRAICGASSLKTSGFCLPLYRYGATCAPFAAVGGNGRFTMMGVLVRLAAETAKPGRLPRLAP